MEFLHPVPEAVWIEELDALGEHIEEGVESSEPVTYGRFHPRGQDLSWTNWWGLADTAAADHVDDSEGESPSYAVFLSAHIAS